MWGFGSKAIALFCCLVLGSRLKRFLCQVCLWFLCHKLIPEWLPTFRRFTFGPTYFPSWWVYKYTILSCSTEAGRVITIRSNIPLLNFYIYMKCVAIQIYNYIRLTSTTNILVDLCTTLKCFSNDYVFSNITKTAGISEFQPRTIRLLLRLRLGSGDCKILRQDELCAQGSALGRWLAPGVLQTEAHHVRMPIDERRYSVFWFPR